MGVRRYGLFAVSIVSNYAYTPPNVLSRKRSRRTDASKFRDRVTLWDFARGVIFRLAVETSVRRNIVDGERSSTSNYFRYGLSA